MKAKIFLSSIVTIALCLSLIVGSTFALFSKTETVNIAVTAGKVAVEAKILTDSDNFKPDFKNGGSATFAGTNQLNISKMTPGDSVTFKIQVENGSNIPLKYKASAESKYAAGIEADTKDLSDALECTAKFMFDNAEKIETLTKTDKDFATDYCTSPVAETVQGGVTIEVTITLPTTTDSAYQGAGAALIFTVEAVQAN